MGKVEAHLAEKHPELKNVAAECGARRRHPKVLDIVKDRLAAWFERLLRGGNRHGPGARAAVCDRVSESLRMRSKELCDTTFNNICDVLEKGVPEEEGPLI